MSMDRIEDLEALRRHYGAPFPRAVEKVKPFLEERHRRFIERSPFLVIGSRGPGGADVSPRGDAPGFVHVLDEKTLALPDRKGNRRVDTFENVLADPHVAAIFFVPGSNETLRVNGRAKISVASELLERLGDGRPALAALVIEIDEVFHQCARAVMRAGLWNAVGEGGEGLPRLSATPDSKYEGDLY